MILGHGHPAVVAAVTRRVRRSVATGTPSPDEPRLARRIRDAMPSLERLRFVCSGTEACMSALRLARAATGRDAVIKFEGCYHGHGDAFLSSAGSGALTFDAPDSPGVPQSVVANTLTVPYNDLAAVERAFLAHRGKIAAVIVEPIVGNMGFVEPLDGLPRGAAPAVRRPRGAARVRRGDDGLSRPPGRRAGALRRAARSDHARQGDRRRLPRRGVRRARRPPPADRARGQGLSGRHALRQSGGHDRGTRDAPRAARARRLRRARRDHRPARRRARAGARRAGASTPSRRAAAG